MYGLRLGYFDFSGRAIYAQATLLHAERIFSFAAGRHRARHDYDEAVTLASRAA